MIELQVKLAPPSRRPRKTPPYHLILFHNPPTNSVFSSLKRRYKVLRYPRRLTNERSVGWLPSAGLKVWANNVFGQHCFCTIPAKPKGKLENRTWSLHVKIHLCSINMPLLVSQDDFEPMLPSPRVGCYFQ